MASQEIKEANGMTTVAEAAKLLKVSVRRVHDFITEGRLPAKMITPRLYLLDLKDIEKFAKIPRKTGAAGHAKKALRR